MGSDPENLSPGRVLVSVFAALDTEPVDVAGDNIGKSEFCFPSCTSNSLSS